MTEKAIKQTDIAVVLVNLGTPDEPTPKAVARYLREFLSDTRVVEVPSWVWFWILNFIIVPRRASKVAKLYQSIWYQNDSPMRVILKEQVGALQARLREMDATHRVHVIDAMTYGNPSLTRAFDEVARLDIQRVLIVPMYPQYSATTTAAVYDQVARVLMKRRNVPEIRYIRQYYDDAYYLDALAHTIERYWNEEGRKPQCLLFSFHGIPQKYSRKGDPYPQQCHFTAAAVAARLNLGDGEWIVAFQSRFGWDEWVQPYTTDTLRDLAQKGVTKVDVVCPAFTADCLETLEEIVVQNRDEFIDAGGECYGYIPALNSDASFIDALTKLVRKHIAGW